MTFCHDNFTITPYVSEKVPIMRSACLPAVVFVVLFAGLTLAEENAKTKKTDKPETLAAQLEAQAAQFKSAMPARIQKTFQQAIEDVRKTGIEKSAKGVKDKAPDGKLLGLDKKPVVLSELWKEKPLVVTWYRGGWCPYCNLQLKALENSLKSIDGQGATLVAISPELPKHVKTTVKKNKLNYKVLHDKENKLAHKYGIVFKLPEALLPIYKDRLQIDKINGYEKMELPLAATYVIDTKGVIRYAFLNADYTKRAEPADVVKAVNKINE